MVFKPKRSRSGLYFYRDTSCQGKALNIKRRIVHFVFQHKNRSTVICIMLRSHLKHCRTSILTSHVFKPSCGLKGSHLRYDSVVIIYRRKMESRKYDFTATTATRYKFCAFLSSFLACLYLKTLYYPRFHAFFLKK